MLINASHPEENRVAIVVDGILSELDIEIAGQEQSKGNIYKAVVVRVETGLQAAFVDYGAEKLGFLQIGELHPNLYPPKDETKGRPRIADILKRGQEILVQIVKEERGNKGAALTTFLSIPGRYMVLMPDSTTKGVSRKIADDTERKKLKKTMAELDLPERMGYIVRTAGIGKDKDELKRDFDYLVRLFEGITAHKDQIKAPAQLYQESNLAIRSIRDYFTTDIDEVLIDSQTVYQDAKDFFSLVMPELGHLVKQHRERRPIFSRYQIEEQIDALAKNQIALPSGGSIVIDQTEALVAIDVNSGKMASESGIEATALKTNLEAATEVGRQLRLRDLGGLIVIDFIDMRDRKNTREVEQALRKALKNDKAKVSVGRISQFGLLEMSRQRLKPVLSVGSFLPCPHCKGAGKIKSAEAQAVTLLRQIHTAASKGHIAYIDATVPMEVANYLLNQKRATIVTLEKQLELEITILGSSKLLPGEIEVETRKKEKEQENDRQIAPISHANQIEVALAAQQEEQDSSALQNDEADTVDQDELTTEAIPESQQEPVKKKRRRRRRKPSAKSTDIKGEDQPDSTGLPQAETAEDSAATQEDQPVATADTANAIGHSTELNEPAITATDSPLPAPVVDEEKKPRRRSRRQSRKKPAGEIAAPKQEEGVPVSATESTTEKPETQISDAQPETPKNTAVPEVGQAATEEKPKRRSRRTSSSVKTKHQDTTVALSQESDTAPTTSGVKRSNDDTPKTSIAATSEPKEQKTADPVQTLTETAKGIPADGEVEKTAAEKPKRRTRRSPQKTTAEKITQTVAAPEEKPVTAAVNEAAENPKRRSSATRTKTAAPIERTVIKPVETETVAPKAQPVTATDTATAGSLAAVKSTGQASPELQKSAPGEEKPKRRSRRTTAKTKSATDSTVKAAEPSADTAAEEKPKRRTRKTTTKTKTAVAPDDAPSEPAAE